MPTRLRYPELAPEGYAALSGFGHYINTATSFGAVLLGLVNLRASLVNGCDFCIGVHKAELRKLHEPPTRIDAVERWRESEAFTPRERSALAWTDVITNLTGGTHASEQDYAEVTQFFTGKDIVDLTFAIASINAWNRMGVAFRPEWRPRPPANQTAVPRPSPNEHTGSPPASEDTQPGFSDDGGKVAEDSTG